MVCNKHEAKISVQQPNSAGDDFSKLPSRSNMFYMYAHPETLLRSGGAFYFRRIYLVVRSTYVHVHTCLEEEYRIINQYGSCTLRSLRLLCCCFPLNRRQISSGIPSSPLFATATKTQTSKGLAWRLNKSACNSANGTYYAVIVFEVEGF